jgi:hypothetical protein
MRALPDRPFWHISIAGIFFQGGAAAVDTSTIIAALVHGLTGGSALAVGTAAAISRFGWLFPQLFVAYYAQRRRRRGQRRRPCRMAIGSCVEWQAVRPVETPGQPPRFSDEPAELAGESDQHGSSRSERRCVSAERSRIAARQRCR